MDTKNNEKQSGPLQIRQGDVLLTKIDHEVMEAIKPIGGMLILAEGEQTGHVHGVPATDARLMRDIYGGRILEVIHPTRLLHEEHAPIALERGVYEVSRQREYNPLNRDTLTGD